MTQQFRFVTPWHAVFPREGGHLVGVAGSGGKTGLLRLLAGVYRDEGVPVVVTTTTRTEVLDWPHLAARRHGEAGWDAAIPTGGILALHAGTDAEGKWRGLEPDEVDALGGVFPEAVLLVETDGAAGLPLKRYRTGEPVWPSRTSLAVAVMGLGALDEPAEERIHRWSGDPARVVDWALYEELLADPEGYLAHLPEGVPPLLLLNQLDLCQDSIGLFAFLEKVMNEVGLPLVMLGDLAADPPLIRTAARHGDVAEAPDGGDDVGTAP